MEKLTKKEINDKYLRALDVSNSLDTCRTQDLRPIYRGISTVLSDLALLNESGYDEVDSYYYKATVSLCHLVVDRFSILVYTRYKANLPL